MQGGKIRDRQAERLDVGKLQSLKDAPQLFDFACVRQVLIWALQHGDLQVRQRGRQK